MYSVCIIYYELQNTGVAFAVTRKNAIILKLGHKTGTVQYINA